MPPTGKPKSLDDAIAELRRPFTAAAIKWKIQAGNQRRVIVVYYLDARLVSERLNAVVGGDWTFDFPMPVQSPLRVDLTVLGVTRSDVGEAGSGPQGKSAKAIVSDALKRAAVHFGVGASVYAIPKLELSGDANDGYVRWWVPDAPKKPQPFLQPKGDDAARAHYEAWLEPLKRELGSVLDRYPQVPDDL